MRIAIIRREIVTYLDGVNRFIFNLADGLSSLGNEVYVVSYSVHSSSRIQVASELKNLFAYEGGANIFSLTKETNTLKWPKIALTWMRSGSSLLKALEVDAVIINGIVPLRIKSLKLAVNHGNMQGLLFNSKRLDALKNDAYSAMGKYLYRNYVNSCVCVSKQLQGEFRSLVGLDSTYIPLPVKLKNFKNKQISNRKNIILHIGTRPEKNVEVSIKAIKTLVEKFRLDAKLIVIGPRNAQTEQLVAKYKSLIPSHLDFLFNISMPDLADLLSSSKALLLPSSYETVGYVILEAFSSGLPVIVSQAIPTEIVSDSQNGFVVHSMDASQYAAKLSLLLSDDNLWTSFSKQAIRTAGDFDHLKIAKAYEHLIENSLCQFSPSNQ